MGGYATNPDTNATSEITGSGTANYMAKFTAAQVIGNSTVQDDGTTVSTTSLFRVGNPAAPGGSLSQMRVGIGTSYLDFGQASAGSAGIWFTTSTPTSSNYVVLSNGADTIVQAPSISGAVSLGLGNSINTYSTTRYATTFTVQAATSGTNRAFTFTTPATTGQTASTEVNAMQITSATRQWATGAITTQREVYITSPTYSFVGASTISSAYTLYVEAPTAGTNATINSNYALGLSGSMAFVGGNGSIIGSNGVTVQSSSGSNVSLNAGSASATCAIIYAQGTERFRFNTGTATSGAITVMTVTPATYTGQTASTEVNGYLYNSYSKTWGAGAITTQREHYFKTVTYAFASASTISEAYGMYIEPPTAGTNATITNKFGLGISNGSYSIKMGQLTGSSTVGAIYMLPLATTVDATNYTLKADGTDTFLNAQLDTSLYLRNGNNTVVRLGGTFQTFSPRVAATGALTNFTFIQSANTGQTASTEIPGFKFTGGSRQWSTGAITTQRETYFSTTTYTAVGASTITNAYGMYVEKPTASTNITITNNWSIGTDGKIQATGYDMNAYGYVMTKAGIGIISNQFSSNGGFSIASQTLALPVGILVGGTDGVEVARFSGQTTSGATNQIAFSGSSTTGQTNLTEISGVLFNSYSRAWAAGIGTITTQREYYVKTVTYTQATNALTITNAYGMYVEAPTASTNVTITNNYALGLSGDLNFNATTGIISATTNLLNKAASTVRTLVGATTIMYTSASGLSLKRDAVAPEGYLHLGAGLAGTNQCPIKFTSGTNLTTPETGAMEYNGTNLFFTRSGTTRESIICANAVNSVSPTAQNRTITVVIDGTTYYLTAKTTND